MDINIWLKKFKENWIQKNIPDILDLFADKIEYRETPYEKYITKEDVAKLWDAINNQENIKLDLKLFGKDLNKYTIAFDLSYSKNTGEKRRFKGVYLMELSDDNKCKYFMQIGE